MRRLTMLFAAAFLLCGCDRDRRDDETPAPKATGGAADARSADQVSPGAPELRGDRAMHEDGTVDAAANDNRNRFEGTANDIRAAPGNHNDNVAGGNENASGQGGVGGTGPMPQTGGDPAFVHAAASANRLEIELGKMAFEKANDAAVRDFGRRMIDDHSKAQTELEGIVKDTDINLSSDLDAHHREMVDRLSRLSGVEFDREYISMMVEDHQKVIERFESQTRNGHVAALRDFASKTVATLREHRSAAEEIRAKLK
ncbi:MAG TPA: DUF4142 domain-containing protein [Phycisphaerae bacterium]|nr:DUF4142 domain-containing protein [Phycisphaerae bacterium]